MYFPSIETLIDIYRRYGERPYTVSQNLLSHSVHCAQQARNQNLSEAQILASFYHDLGLLLNLDAYSGEHENIGADYLARQGFNAAVCEPIRLHVAAKRYLCWKKPRYYSLLPECSKETLLSQGGVMDTAEALSFEARAFSDTAMQLRKIDDTQNSSAYALSEADWVFALSEKHLKNQEV